MDHTVAANEIRRDDLGAVNRHTRLVGLERELLAVHRRRFTGLHVGRHDFGWDDVIGEDRNEFGFVLGLQQRINRAGGQFGESSIGGRKNGERTGAAQGFDEPGGLHGGDERGVIGRADGDFDDGLGRNGRDQAGAECEGGEQGAELHGDEN